VGDREAKEEARGFFFWKLFLCVQSMKHIPLLTLHCCFDVCSFYRFHGFLGEKSLAGFSLIRDLRSFLFVAVLLEYFFLSAPEL